MAMWAMIRENRSLVSCLGAKIVPVLCAHAQGSRFVELWHAFEGDRGEFHDFGCEYV